MTQNSGFSLLRRLNPIQITLSIGTGVLTLIVGVLILNLYFNIVATNSAFQAGYIITDLTDIQRAVLLLQNQNDQILSSPAASLDFESLDLQRALLTSQMRLAIRESASNDRLVAELNEMQLLLDQYDAILAELKATPTPEQVGTLGPQLDTLLDELSRQSKTFSNQEENRFFSGIGNTLESQRFLQTLLVVLSGLLLLFSGLLIFSLRRTVNDEFAKAYRQLEEEVVERKQAEAELRESHAELSVVNRDLERLNGQLQDELTLAHKIQRSLLPPARPDWHGFDVVCYSVPAREIGGDFYAYHSLGNGRFSLAVGDVSGKGLSAALLMATSVAHFDSAFTSQLPPGETLIQLDQALLRYTETTSQNCALCYIEIMDGVLRVANAGGVPPYIRRAAGGVEELEVGGLPLGVGLRPHFGYQTLSIPLAPGDLVILTSDGVAEAHTNPKYLYGFPRLEQAVADGPTSSAQAMLEYLKDSVNHFIDDAEPPDDLTIVVLQVTG